MNLDQFREELSAHSNPVIVDLWAPWCRPCLKTKPVLEALARDYDGRVDFWAINADEHPLILSELRIFSIPTILVTRNGEILQAYTGAQSREGFRSLFEAMSRSGSAITVSMSSRDRLLRLFAGSAIAAIGFATSSWLLIIMGGAVGFLGVYDRCPVWRAVMTFFSPKTP